MPYMYWEEGGRWARAGEPKLALREAPGPKLKLSNAFGNSLLHAVAQGGGLRMPYMYREEGGR